MLLAFLMHCHQSNPYSNDNKPPHTPLVISPTDKEKNVSVILNLQWSGGDPDAGDVVVYDIRLGENENSLVKIDSNLTVNIYRLSGLTFSTTYYWQVIARDRSAQETSGSIWAFSTRPENVQPPVTPHSPDPINGSTTVDIHNVSLRWQGGTPNPADSVRYDIYFGTISPPPQLIASNRAQATFQLPLLNFGTQYFWQINATNVFSLEAVSPVWNFTTKSAVVQFYESFDNYLAGSRPPDTSWTFWGEPGTLSITDAVYFGNQGKSCQFTDTSDSNSITLINEVLPTAIGVLEFAWRVDHTNDHIGLRLYADNIQANQRGPQIAIKGDSLLYYDRDYTWKFVTDIDSTHWYNVRIVFDCERENYHIYVNDVLKIATAGWTGADIDVIKYIYFHTFDDKICKAGYIDDIKFYTGSSFGELVYKSTNDIILMNLER